MCAVPNIAVFCSSLTSWFPGKVLTYFLNDFEMVPVALLLLLLLLLTAIELLLGDSTDKSNKKTLKKYSRAPVSTDSLSAVSVIRRLPRRKKREN
jgi:hypothetical protein